MLLQGIISRSSRFETILEFTYINEYEFLQGAKTITDTGDLRIPKAGKAQVTLLFSSVTPRSHQMARKHFSLLISIKSNKTNLIAISISRITVIVAISIRLVGIPLIDSCQWYRTSKWYTTAKFCIGTESAIGAGVGVILKQNYKVMKNSYIKRDSSEFRNVLNNMSGNG